MVVVIISKDHRGKKQGKRQNPKEFQWDNSMRGYYCSFGYKVTQTSIARNISIYLAKTTVNSTAEAGGPNFCKFKSEKTLFYMSSPND